MNSSQFGSRQWPIVYLKKTCNVCFHLSLSQKIDLKWFVKMSYGWRYLITRHFKNDLKTHLILNNTFFIFRFTAKFFRKPRNKITSMARMHLTCCSVKLFFNHARWFLEKALYVPIKTTVYVLVVMRKLSFNYCYNKS